MARRSSGRCTTRSRTFRADLRDEVQVPARDPLLAVMGLGPRPRLGSGDLPPHGVAEVRPDRGRDRGTGAWNADDPWAEGELVEGPIVAHHARQAGGHRLEDGQRSALVA